MTAPGASVSPDSRKGARTPSHTFARNLLFSVTRILINAAAALLLPAYLTKHLSTTTYGAWVLILQLSAYVSFLDLGVQTAVAKFVAEFDAKGDLPGASRRASSGLLIMVFAAALGIGLTTLLAWTVPRLFGEMPADLYGQVRLSLMAMGTSLSFTLVSSAFASVFLGLQRFRVPLILSIANRISSAAVVLLAVSSHSTLATMALAAAAINILTAGLQIFLCKRLIPQIRVALRPVDRGITWQVLQSCAILAIISGAMLCISGLDLTIVGKYDFRMTGYYAVAASPNTLMLMLLAATMAPLLPAASALNATTTADHMGRLLLRISRYSSLLLFISGTVLFLFGHQMLVIWVGEVYADNAMPLLRVLVIANVLRNLYAPYATMIVAVGKQTAIIASSLSEAVVNLGSSIYLASHFGALGVAYGTLLGSGVGVVAHVVVSMRQSHVLLPISRKNLLLNSFLRPALVTVPSLGLLMLRYSVRPHIENAWASWGCLLSGTALGLIATVPEEERRRLSHVLIRRLAAR